MVPFLFVRVIWDAHTISFPLRIHTYNMRELHVSPEPAHPFGRKGLVLASAWQQLGTAEGQLPAAGMLLLDGDVMIDPHDMIMMHGAILTEPTAVHTAPVRLWPVSKNDLEGWAWGHWKNSQPGQGECDDPDFFSFNFTYVPRAVLDAAVKSGLKGWQFPNVDRRMSAVARATKTPIRVVKDCLPKHMHY